MGPAGHKRLNASGAVKASGGALVAFQITGGGDAATVTLYDNPSAGSGVILGKLSVAAGISDDFCPCMPYAFSKGCYATITGTTPEVVVVFL